MDPKPQKPRPPKPQNGGEAGNRADFDSGDATGGVDAGDSDTDGAEVAAAGGAGEGLEVGDVDAVIVHLA